MTGNQVSVPAAAPGDEAYRNAVDRMEACSRLLRVQRWTAVEVREAESLLKDRSRKALIVSIAALLAEYPARDDIPANVMKAMMARWLAELEDRPSWAVEAACREWLRDGMRSKYRPRPGEICDIANQKVFAVRMKIHEFHRASAPPPPTQPEITPEERQASAKKVLAQAAVRVVDGRIRLGDG